MQELRRLPRAPVKCSGMLHFANGTTYPCIVTDISGCGAKISLLRSQVLPDEFELTMDGIKSRVRSKWQTRFQVGVEFVTAGSVGADATPTKP
jgi:hypothetical protein